MIKCTTTEENGRISVTTDADEFYTDALVGGELTQTEVDELATYNIIIPTDYAVKEQDAQP